MPNETGIRKIGNFKPSRCISESTTVTQHYSMHWTDRQTGIYPKQVGKYVMVIAE